MDTRTRQLRLAEAAANGQSKVVRCTVWLCNVPACAVALQHGADGWCGGVVYGHCVVAAFQVAELLSSPDIDVNAVGKGALCAWLGGV